MEKATFVMRLKEGVRHVAKHGHDPQEVVVRREVLNNQNMCA